jgi:hypothetical protein
MSLKWKPQNLKWDVFDITGQFFVHSKRDVMALNRSLMPTPTVSVRVIPPRPSVPYSVILNLKTPRRQNQFSKRVSGKIQYASWQRTSLQLWAQAVSGSDRNVLHTLHGIHVYFTSSCFSMRLYVLFKHYWSEFNKMLSWKSTLKAIEVI